MCMKIPKGNKPPGTPPPVEAPKIELGSEKTSSAVRKRARVGRNQLRTGLSVPTDVDAGVGLNAPQ